LQSTHEGVLEVAFSDAGGEGEEVEDVGVADQLLGEVRVRGGQLVGKVGGGGPDTGAQVGGDVVGQNVAGPPVLDGGPGVEVAVLAGGELVEQDGDVAQGSCPTACWTIAWRGQVRASLRIA